MSHDPVPRHVDFRRCAAGDGQLNGSIALADLPRIRDLLAEDDGSVEIDLRCGTDDEDYRYIAGQVHAVLALQCQRCLGAVRVDLASDVSLAMVWSEAEMPSLPSRFEGLVVGTEPQDLYELVEEELLLALPLVPRHAEGACGAPGTGAAAEDAGESRENPFRAALQGRWKAKR